MMGRLTPRQRAIVLAFVAGLVVLFIVYRATFVSLVAKWYTDAAFSHGFLILPIALWLAWRKRDLLMSVEWRSSWLGVVAITAAAASWVVARGTGVLVVEQYAAVVMIPALVLAVFGVRATRILAFPLAFLFFSVPVGRALVPLLMEWTADIATWTLEASGVPIIRSHLYISIPSGNFEVARACSGLNYVVTGLVLGILYAYLTYQSWRKRLLCVLAFLVVPIVANGLRVYVTIGVSHLTEMRFGPGGEHVTFGRYFFIAIMLAMFWVGQRWRDDRTVSVGVRAPPSGPAAVPAWAGSRIVVPAALAAMLIGPALYASSSATSGVQAQQAEGEISLPAAAGVWRGPIEMADSWRPLFEGALAERVGTYLGDDGARVDVYVGAYGLGASAGAEMISYRNRLYPSERTSVAPESKRTLQAGPGEALVIRELRLSQEGAGGVLVWQWYRVGDRATASEFAVKGFEALAFVTGRTPTEVVITLATPLDDLDQARGRLESFVASAPACVGSGFSARACGG